MFQKAMGKPLSLSALNIQFIFVTFSLHKNIFTFCMSNSYLRKPYPSRVLALDASEIPWIPLCTLLLQMPSYNARTSVSGIKLKYTEESFPSQDYSHWEGRWYNYTRTCWLKQVWVKVMASARQVSQISFFLMARHMPAPGASGYLGKTVVLLHLEELYVILCSISRGCFQDVPGRTRSQ